MTEQTHPPDILSREEWLAAMEKHRAKKKTLAAPLDQLAAERRHLPRERVERT